MRKFVETARHGIQSRLHSAEGSQSEAIAGRDSNPPSFTKQDVSQQRHLEEENVILKEELQRLTAQLIASEDESRGKGAAPRGQINDSQNFQQLQKANSLLQAKVGMLRDNLKAARVSSSEMESEVAQLKLRLAASGLSPAGDPIRANSQAVEGRDVAAHSAKQTRSLSEDGGSQGQLWMQLDALQKENARLAEANHVLSAQMATSNAQRVELQSRWTEHERLMSLDLASAKAEISRLENDLKAAERESTSAPTPLGKSIAELGAETESLHQTNRMLTDQIRSLQAKADEARQTVEIVSAENAQLGAHVQLLESELEAVQAGSLGRNLGSNENSPRGTEEHPLVFEEAHGVTPQAAAAEQGHEPAEEGASPAFSLIENSAYDQDGTGATRPSTAGSREDASSAADKEGMATAEKAEADFHFSSLKRKWHAEEGKYLAHELRRAQDLNVQQEMELESLRQQVAALSSVCSEEQLETLREKAAQADSAMKMAEKLQAEMALLQEQVETLHSRDNHVAELKEEAEAQQGEADKGTASSGTMGATTDQLVGAPEEQQGPSDSASEQQTQSGAVLEAELRGQLEGLEARDTQAQAEAATLRQQLAELTTSLEEEKARFVLADNQLQASQAQQKELELDLQLKAQGDSELESALTEAKGKVAELLQLEDALRSKEEDVKMMSDQIAQQEAELTLLKRRKTDDDVEKQERLLELETSLQIAQDEREKVQSILLAERANSSGKKAALAETILALDQAKAHAGAKEEEVVRLKGHVERAEQASHRSAAELEARLAAVASELDDAKVALADRERVCGELQMTSSGAEAEIASLKGQLKQLMDKLEAAIEASRAVPSVGGEAANGDADANQQSAAAQGDAEKELIELQKAVSLRDGDVEALKKQLEAASARADGHYAALQEINEQLQGIQRSHTEALQKSATAVQEKEQVAAEMEKMEKAHAAERHGLKEKLERLQRANKQRRGEIEEMQTKLSSMHQRASAYDQTFQELQQLRKENLDIKPLAAAHPQLLEEVSACRAEVKAAEKRIASFDALAKKAATVFEARLDGVGREKDQLLEQVAVLKSATVANEALQLQAAAAQRELTTALEAAAAAAAHQQRAVAAEKAAAEARKEAQVAQAAAAAMEERLQAAEEEMDRITGAVEEERARRAAAARAYAEELEGLPLKPVSSWPAPVRVLVRQREAAAAEAGAAGVRQEASAAEAALEAELEEARVARDSAEAEKRQAIAARDKAEAHTAGVSKELAEREECLGNLLRAARAEAAAASEEHQADIAELRHTLELRVATVRADVADWQARAEAAEKELSAVKERAWALMEEKDAQLQAAKGLKILRPAEYPAEVDSPLPLSHSASTSTVQDALAQGAQISEAGQELRASDNGNPTAGVLSQEEQDTGAGVIGVDEITLLKQRISLLENELVESENTHRLRDQAQAVAKQEIAELQRKGKREGLDLTYLKNVILRGFESGELPAKSSMLPVLARLLEFSSQELDRVRNPKKKP